MRKGFLSIRAFDYEEPPLHVEVFASNGSHSARQDFYCGLEDLENFGRALTSFPSTLEAEARLEVGDRNARSAHFVLLRAYVYDIRGHTALEVELIRNFTNPNGAAAHFHIPCEAASLNRLGQDLLAWCRDRTGTLEWQVAAQQLVSADKQRVS